MKELIIILAVIAGGLMTTRITREVASGDKFVILEWEHPNGKLDFQQEFVERERDCIEGMFRAYPGIVLLSREYKYINTFEERLKDEQELREHCARVMAAREREKL